MNEQNAPELDQDALQALQDLVARLEQHQGPWGIMKGGEKTGENRYKMPYVELDPLAHDAMKFLYDQHLIIPFNWSEWDDGREIFRSTQEDRFTTLDRQTVLKLLTAVARNDRFNDGAWAGLFEDGSGQVLFKRLLDIEISSK